MTDAERLTDLRERFGPAATRVGDPPTAGDVALLLRMLDQPKCVDDAKVDEIRERYRESDIKTYTYTVIHKDHEQARRDVRTLLAALEAEHKRAEKAERQRDMALRGSDTHDMDE